MFRNPGSATVVVAGLVATIGHFTTVLSTVFLLSAGTGRYAAAGAVASAYALTYAVVSPMTSRLADRYPVHRVLVCTAVAGAGCRAGFLVAALAHAPVWALFLLSGMSGAAMPSVGSVVRARWANLLRGTSLLRTALALQSILDELVFVVGPLIVSVLATSVSPAAPPALGLLLIAGGQVTLAVQCRRATEERRHSEAAAPTRGSLLRRSGFVPMVVGFIAIGAAQTMVELVTVAFCQQHGVKSLSGVVLALFALGSATAGLWYGSRDWRMPAQRMLVMLAGLFAAGTWLFVAAPTVWFLAGAALVLGATLAPMTIAGFSVVHQRIEAARLTEGMTWLSTGMGLGIGVGSVTAGSVVDALGTRVSFIVAAGAALIAVVAFVGLSRSRVDVAAGEAPA